MNTVSTNGLSFVDELGRERIFNGLNFVYKGYSADEDGSIPYRTDITDELLKKLVAKGVNIIRLGFTWAGVEPEQGKYNDLYIEGLARTLDLCEKNGVYAFLDAHQDLYGIFGSGYGDGAPEWACLKCDMAKKIYVIWAEGYFLNPAVHTSFDAFWNNSEVNGKGLQDSFCDMYRYVANALKDKPALMGFDLLNEPFPGTPGGKVFRTLVANGVLQLMFNNRVNRKKLVKDAISKDILELLTVADDPKVYHSIIDAANKLIRKFDEEKYSPFLSKAATAVRQVTDKGVIFFENCYYSNLGIPCNAKHIECAGEKEKSLAFTPHGYDITVDTPLTNNASPYRVDMIFNEHRKTQLRLGVPVLVGEWGGMVPGAEEYPALEHLIKKFDSNQWSQTYWHYFKDFESSKIMEVLARPLPQAVAGKIKSYSYDRKTKTFVLSYSGSSVIKAPTLVYLPEEPKKIYSTKGYTLKEQPEGGYILKVYAGKGECIVKAEF